MTWSAYESVMLKYDDEPRNQPAVGKIGIVVEPPAWNSRAPHWMTIDVEGKEYGVRGDDCVKPEGRRPSLWVSPKKLAERIIRVGEVTREIEADGGPCGRHSTLELREEELHVLCTILKAQLPLLSEEKIPCLPRDKCSKS